MKILTIFTSLVFAIVAALMSAISLSAAGTGMMCTMQYAPVCASLEVQCITAPCNPVQQTYSNSCMAASAGAEVLYEGECRPTVGKMSPQRALKDGTWILESFNGKTLAHTGTLMFHNNRFHAKLCNSVNGRYVAMSSRLILRNMYSTKMYCDTDIMPVETALMSINRGTYMVGSNSLTITTRKGDVIVWKK